MGHGSSSSRRRRQHQASAEAPATMQYVVAAPYQYPPITPNFFHPSHSSGSSPAPPQSPPSVEHQKPVTIRNAVNVKKESIGVEEDEENFGTFLVSFTFDAVASGSITVMFFAKEDGQRNLIPTKQDVLKPIVTVNFEQGLGQKFRQPSGSGIDFSLFDDRVLKVAGEEGVYPLVLKLKADACPSSSGDGSDTAENSQITLAVFEKKDNGEHVVRVMKQVLWLNGTSYELHEIYGMENSVDVESDANGSGKECVICMSEPRDTTVLPCRHMCICKTCAKALQVQKDNRCPICRQLIQSLLEIKMNDGTEE